MSYRLWVYIVVPVLVVILVPALSTAQTKGFADEAVPDVSWDQPAPPKPRSLEIPGAFTEDRIILLPLLTEQDMESWVGSNPPVTGLVHELEVRSDRDGAWTLLPGGGRLWTVALRSPNAVALRVRFDPFDPAPGGEVILHGPGIPASARGPLDKGRAAPNRSLWSPAVAGGEIRVEYFVPEESSPSPEPLIIKGVLQRLPTEDPAAQAACRIDVNCYSAWDVTANAVAMFYFMDGGLEYQCSGAMIARPTPDFARLFLTAAHCVNSEPEASSVEVIWFYESNTCDGASPHPSTLPHSDGATLLGYDNWSDNALIGLLDAVPNGLTWAGWNSDQAPDPTNATLIHHPGGTRKAISGGRLEGVTLNAPCTGADGAYYFDLYDGGQEGGSSGSPVFDDANHHIRAVATCSEDPGCDPGEMAYEGAFRAAFFEVLYPFLEGQLDTYVWGIYSGTEHGTYEHPWNTLTESAFSVKSGGTIHVAAGIYPPVTLSPSPGDPRSFTLVADDGVVTIGQ